MDYNTVLNNLVDSLKASDPYKIVLFGSYANVDEIEKTGRIIYEKAG